MAWFIGKGVATMDTNFKRSSYPNLSLSPIYLVYSSTKLFGHFKFRFHCYKLTNHTVNVSMQICRAPKFCTL